MPTFEIAGFDVVPVAAGAAALLAVAWLVRTLKKEKQPDFVVPMRCPDCGWRGQRSKYNRACPSCARPSLKPAG